MALKLSSTSRGNPCLTFNSMPYRRDRILKSGIISWRCMTKGCPVSMKTNAVKTVVLEAPGQHNHPTVSGGQNSTVTQPEISTPGLAEREAPMSPPVSSPSLTEMLAPYNVNITPIQKTHLDVEEENSHLRRLVSELNYQKDALTNRCIDLEGRLLEQDSSLSRQFIVTGTQTNEVIIDNESSEMIESLRTSLEVLEAENIVLRSELSKFEPHFRSDSTNVFKAKIESKISRTTKSRTKFNPSQQSFATANKFDCLYIDDDVVDTCGSNENRNSVETNRDECKGMHAEIDGGKSVKRFVEDSSVDRSAVLKYSTRCKNKIRLFTDIQGRNCEKYMAKYLNDQIQLSSFVSSGAGLQHVLETAEGDREVVELGRDDCVVILAGTDSFNNCSTEEDIVTLLWRIEGFIVRLKYTNLVLATIPYRYDEQQLSVVNKRIKLFNVLLRSLVNRHENVSILELFDLPRRLHTFRGLHLNTWGKRYVARKIVDLTNRSITRKHYNVDRKDCVVDSHDVYSVYSSTHDDWITIDETFGSHSTIENNRIDSTSLEYLSSSSSEYEICGPVETSIAENTGTEPGDSNNFLGHSGGKRLSL
jgi:hypothetical protein